MTIRNAVCAALLILFVSLVPQRAGAQDLSALPLHEVPSSGPQRKTLGLLISGDGGWAAIDKGLARALADSGISIVGLNARSYLGTRRSPEDVAGDIARILHHYLAAWGRERVIVVGYSRGAVIAPFIVNRLPDDLRARVDLVAMLGLGRHAGFHVSLFDRLRTTTSDKDPAVAPEVEALVRAKVRMMCVYGSDEPESFCRDAPEGWMTKIGKRGAHHFDGDHAALAIDILTQLDRPS